MSSVINPASGGYGDTVVRPAVPARSPEAHRELTELQREQFGGLKVGASFFGWLSATGMAVLLTALVAALGAAFGISGTVNLDRAAGDPQAAGLVGGVTLLVVILVAYFCGGYVAGRMARFNGVKQGLGVWLWGIVVAVVLTIVGFVAGAQLGNPPLQGLPPVPASAISWNGVIVVAAVLVVSLIGALLGGLAGMRYHRRVDRVTAD
jgi:amino acid transporter